MNLPIQTAPVQRLNSVQAFAESRPSSEGVLPSQYGVDASGWLDDALGVVRTVGQVGSTLGPMLGAIGI
jgi:hypothetical protein